MSDTTSRRIGGCVILLLLGVFVGTISGPWWKFIPSTIAALFIVALICDDAD